jgi:hypothetical protein
MLSLFWGVRLRQTRPISQQTATRSVKPPEYMGGTAGN